MDMNIDIQTVIERYNKKISEYVGQIISLELLVEKLRDKVAEYEDAEMSQVTAENVVETLSEESLKGVKATSSNSK